MCDKCMLCDFEFGIPCPHWRDCIPNDYSWYRPNTITKIKEKCKKMLDKFNKKRGNKL